MAERSSASGRSCNKCGEPMDAWVTVWTDKSFLKAEEYGEIKMPRGIGAQEWCLDCIRKSDNQRPSQ